jgi:hypothetical protein
VAYCPFCRVTYKADVQKCPNCQVALVEGAPPTGEKYQSVEETSLDRFNSLIEAEMAADLLRQAGIPSALVPLGPGAGGWGTSLWSPHELRVRADDVKRAREILG